MCCLKDLKTDRRKEMKIEKSVRSCKLTEILCGESKDCVFVEKILLSKDEYLLDLKLKQEMPPLAQGAV